MRQAALASIAAVTLTAAGGCLSASYRIPADELERLANEAPSRRGDAVRVVQRFGTADDPPTAYGFTPYDQERSAAWQNGDPALRVDTGTDRPAVQGWGWAHPYRYYQPFHYYRPTPVVFLDVDPRLLYDPFPFVPGVDLAPPPPSGGPAGAGGSGASGGGGGLPSGGDIGVSDDKALAAVVVAVAVAATVGLAVTEGARYDGWLDLDPNHPVHLLKDNGSYEIVALSQLEHRDLEHLDEAIIVEGEGGGIGERGRAPLYRPGMTWRMELGGISVPTSDGGLPTGMGAKLALGYFPIQQLGICFAATLAGGTRLGGDFFGSHYGVEVLAFPLALGRVHLGAYGDVAYRYYASEGGQLPTKAETGGVFEAGGLVELDLTTRLGLDIRGGAIFGHGGPTGMALTMGLAIY